MKTLQLARRLFARLRPLRSTGTFVCACGQKIPMQLRNDHVSKCREWRRMEKMERIAYEEGDLNL